MITASFSANKNLKKVIPKTPVALNEVNNYLADIELYATEHHIIENCELVLKQDGEVIFKDDVKYGIGSSFVQSILLLINHTLETVFKDKSTAQKEALISLVTQSMQIELKPKMDDSDNKVAVLQKPINEGRKVAESEPKAKKKHVKTIDENVIELTRSNYQVQKNKAEKRTRKAFSFQNLKLRLFPYFSLKIVVSIILLLFVFLIAWFGGHVMYSHHQTQQSYAVLVKNKQYLKAAKVYPKKIENIEEVLRKSGKTDDLKRFNQRYETPGGNFDIAFVNHHWSKLIMVKNVNMNRVRKAQLIIAYIHLHQPEEANRLNLEVDNDKLSQAIALEYIRVGNIDQAVKLNERLKSKELNDLINAGRSYEQAIEKYKVDLKKTDLTREQRIQIEENLKVWQRNLKSIGE